MISLRRYHGLGNVFVVAFHPGVDDTELPGLARQVCDPETGPGADGMLVGESPEGGPASSVAARMTLFNADGSRAEMSGNGIRCFAHALAERRGDALSADGIIFDIETDAGTRRVEVRAGDADDSVWATVDMGAVTPLDEPAGWSALGTHSDRPVAHLSMGNPHSIVPVDDVAAVDLLTLGRQIPHVNLEIIEAGPTEDAITMRVHERGAGITRACGTGACAAAFAAVRWGLATPRDDKLVVHMDGGPATVELSDDGSDRVRLIGPSTFLDSTDFPSDHVAP